MPSTPCLHCGKLSDGSYCRKHRPSRTGKPRPWSGWEAGRWRDRVLAFSGGLCAIDGCTSATDRVEAHHLRPVGMGGQLQGPGVALCHQHHHAIHHRHQRVEYTHHAGGTIGRMVAA